MKVATYNRKHGEGDGMVAEKIEEHALVRYIYEFERNRERAKAVFQSTCLSGHVEPKNNS